MINFQNSFQTDSFPSIEGQARDEFLAAQDKVQSFSPGSNTSEEYFEILRRCFSEATNRQYPDAVRHFLQKASMFFTTVSTETVEVEHTVAKRTLGLEERETEVQDCPPINKQQKVDTSTESTSPQREQPRPLTPYLQTCMRFFSNLRLGEMRSQDELNKYWKGLLLLLDDWCERYKKKELLSGRTQDDIDREIRDFRKIADNTIAEEKAEGESILAEFERIKNTLISRYSEKEQESKGICALASTPDSGPSIMEKQRLLWIRSEDPDLSIIDSGVSAQCIFYDIPDEESIWKKIVSLIISYINSEPCFDSIIFKFAATVSLDKEKALQEFSDHLRNFPSQLCDQIRRAATDLAEAIQLKTKSFPCFLRDLMHEHKLSRADITDLSQNTFDLVNRRGEPILEGFLTRMAERTNGAYLSKFCARLENSVALFAYIKDTFPSSIDSKKMSDFFVTADSWFDVFYSLHPYLRESEIRLTLTPFLFFSSLPKDELASFIEQCAESSDPVSLMMLRMYAASNTQFQKLKTLNDTVFSGKKDNYIIIHRTAFSSLLTWTDQEIDDLRFYIEHYQHWDVSDWTLLHFIDEFKEKKRFLNFYTRTFYQLAIEANKRWFLEGLYEWLYNPQYSPQFDLETTALLLLNAFTPDERYQYATRMYSLNSPLYLCCLEGTEQFEQAISSLPLSEVPTEPLIRYICSKPFQEIQSWLQASISSESGNPRFATLSTEQKQAILLRFPRFESALPRKPWIALLGVSEEEAHSLCRIEEYPSSPMEWDRLRQRNLDLTQWHNVLQMITDPNDPFSMLLPCFTVLGKSVKSLISTGIQKVICGGRNFLTWGNAPASSSSCVSQDDIPLQIRYESKLMTLYPRGLFNDYSFGAPVFSLFKRLRSSKLNDPDSFRELEIRAIEFNDPDMQVEIAVTHPQGLPPFSSTLKTREEQEIYYELYRIRSHLQETFLLLLGAGRLDDYPMPFAHLEASEDTSFQELLLHQHRLNVAKNLMNGMIYDNDNSTYRRAYTFLVLLQCLRAAGVTYKDGVTRVAFTPSVLFRLKELDREKIQILPEDNPGLDSLLEFASDYPFHTLSPITPRTITPSKFTTAVKAIQTLTEEQFSALCCSCTAPSFLALDLEFASIQQGVEAWKPFWPAGIDISAALDVLITLSEQYTGTMSGAMTIRPNARYDINRAQLDAFVPAEEIPDFLRSEGNFASALCASFIPVNPYLQNGDCGINSFLLGWAQSSEEVEGGERLNGKVDEFRTTIVEYARNNRALLNEKFGETVISQLIERYTRRVEGELREMTGPEVWWIAAHIYQRPIAIYNCDRVGNVFSLDERCVITPSVVFNPEEGATPLEPIRLAHWSLHYCFLKPRVHS